MKEYSPTAMGVRMVKTDHSSMASVPVMRIPYFSAIMPPGICISV